MSKARIRQITNNDTEIINQIEGYNSQDAYFTLIDKEGNIALNNKHHGIIYKSTLPDKDLAVIEAYGYLSYWAEEEVEMKEFSVLELMSKDFTTGVIHIPEENICFERENYKNEFDRVANAKPLRKLRKAIIDLEECLSKVDRRIDKFSSYLEELDEYRLNPHMYDEPEEEEEEEEEEEYDDEEEEFEEEYD